MSAMIISALNMIADRMALKSPTFKVTNKALLDCRMDRHTKSDTLRRLEQA